MLRQQKCAIYRPDQCLKARLIALQTEKYFGIEIDVARMCRRPVCMQNNAPPNIELIYDHTRRLSAVKNIHRYSRFP